MEDNNIYLASNLKFLRKDKKKTQEDVAKFCGKTNTAVSNWELGIREPDAVDLARLSTYFDVSVDDLMLSDLSKKQFNPLNEIELLFAKHKDLLTESDKKYIKMIIEERMREIDKQLGEE